MTDSYEFIDAFVQTGTTGWTCPTTSHDVISFYKTQTPTWCRLPRLWSASAQPRSPRQDVKAAVALIEPRRHPRQPEPWGAVSQIEPL